MLNEHLWSGIIHRSESGEERKEDLFCSTKEDIQRKIQEIIDKTHPKEGDIIDLNHLDVSSVEDMGLLFCDPDNNINFTKYNFNISDWDVSNVKDMSGMFYLCKNFNCDLSRWNVSNVNDMSGMFYDCEKFTGKWLNKDQRHYNDISNWRVEYVRSMQEMFYNCHKFKCNLKKWCVRCCFTENMFDGCDYYLENRPDWYRY